MYKNKMSVSLYCKNIQYGNFIIIKIIWNNFYSKMYICHNFQNVWQIYILEKNTIEHAKKLHSAKSMQESYKAQVFVFKNIEIFYFSQLRKNGLKESVFV